MTRDYESRLCAEKTYKRGNSGETGTSGNDSMHTGDGYRFYEHTYGGFCG